MRIYLMLGFCFFAHHFSAQNVIAELKAFESKRYAALVSGDLLETKNLLSDKLVYTHSNGVVENMYEYIHALESKKYTFTRFDTDSTRYHFHNQRIVVAAGCVTMQGKYYETEFKLNGRFTAVYVKRKKEWQLAAWQTTKINR